MSQTATHRILTAEDQERLERFLMTHLASSMFLLSNARASGLQATGQPYTGTYAACVDEQVTAVAAQYWNGMLVLQAPHDADILARLVLDRSGRPLQGLIGPAEQVEQALQGLNVDPAGCKLDEIERLYSLSLDQLRVPPNLAYGRVHARRSKPQDLDLLTEWSVAFAVEALGDKDTAELRSRSRASAERLQQEGRSWILEANATPVACSSFNAAIAESVQVGGVWTPPSLRSNGYARAVVAASLIEAKATDRLRAILFTPANNIAAQKAYEALGFVCVGAYRVTLLDRPA